LAFFSPKMTAASASLNSALLVSGCFIHRSVVAMGPL
jgi:hypothetical protein